jgi:hypothetical protein
MDKGLCEDLVASKQTHRNEITSFFYDRVKHDIVGNE